MEVPDKIWLYRIIHINNLPFILKNGLCTASSKVSDPNYQSIGDSSLISFRKNMEACDPPGGKLLEYIPFYLGPRSPMLYQIAKGYEDIPKQAQEDIVYLISSFNQVEAHNLAFFFTDGHARSLTSSFYNSKQDFDKLDWNAIYTTSWKSDEIDLRRKEKKQAEFLVKNHVPVSAIEYLGVFNETAKQKVVCLLKESNVNINVRVSP